MKVNVSKLKNEVITFQNLLKEYEENYLNFYHELSSASFFWQDTHADNFFKNVNLEKMEMETFCDELDSVHKLYKFLVNRYQEIGNIIQFDLNMKNTIFSKFSLYFDRVDSIIKNYQGLDLSFCQDIANIIKEEETVIIENKKKMEDILESVKKYFNKIEEIEKEVNLLISKMNIDLLQEIEINEFI